MYRLSALEASREVGLPCPPVCPTSVANVESALTRRRFHSVRAPQAPGLVMSVLVDAEAFPSYHGLKSPCSHFQSIWNLCHCCGFMYFSKYIYRFTGSGEIPNQRVWKFIPERHKYCYVPTGMVKWMTVKVLVTQSCPALCDPMGCGLPGSSVLLEYVTIPFSRGSSQPRDQPSCPALQEDSLLSEPSDKCLLKIIEINIFQVIVFL